jgi:hypothetical protein
MFCEICTMQQRVQKGEWQCWNCRQWFYSTPAACAPLYDRLPLPEQLTARDQVRIVLACQFLTAQGQRFGSEFGYANARVLAAARGYIEP